MLNHNLPFTIYFSHLAQTNKLKKKSGRKKLLFLISGKYYKIQQLKVLYFGEDLGEALNYNSCKLFQKPNIILRI